MKIKKVIDFLSDVSLGFCIGVMLDAIFDTSFTFQIIGTVIAAAGAAAIYIKKGSESKNDVSEKVDSDTE